MLNFLFFHFKFSFSVCNFLYCLVHICSNYYIFLIDCPFYHYIYFWSAVIFWTSFLMLYLFSLLWNFHYMSVDTFIGIPHFFVFTLCVCLSLPFKLNNLYWCFCKFAFVSSDLLLSHFSSFYYYHCAFQFQISIWVFFINCISLFLFLISWDIIIIFSLKFLNI